MANSVSKNIRRIRQAKGMSQDRLSKKADLALNTIVKVETGENPNPTVETLKKIAKALGVTIGDLFKE
ncbi:MAG TPA: helix-turn-helix transcriptional regulator [Candidatus Paceibacterota bacterium]|jgi:transcriptional regulator with XRE-family HTH domain|nr:helix-turn-helix transcriptional regulator [Candidatus Paceibacterota bacterium]HPW34584.1 helix-turn-helix transcriptional regulator [Candidatus Paceibacterota bacterium]HQI26128.1 helix-turn-helix transcriptional regulator [Candidatus Paceibacterota bacterium]